MTVPTATQTFYVRGGLTTDEANRQFIFDVVELTKALDEYYEDAALTLKRALENGAVFIDPEHLIDAGQFLLEDLGFEVDWADTGYMISKA